MENQEKQWLHQSGLEQDESCTENESAAENLHCLPAALYLAEKMGEGLGRSKILLGALPEFKN